MIGEIVVRKRLGASGITRRAMLAGGLATLVAARALRAAETDAPLKDLARDRGILYGSATSAREIATDADFAALIVRECAAIVPESDMKWGEMTVGDRQFDFTPGDRDVAFAAAHRLAVRGHNLIWYRNTPDWFLALSDRQSAEDAMVQHITEMCRRYEGGVFCWDVVNEAINPADGRPDGLRKAVFLEKLGPNYLDLAYHTARAAAPDAILVLNDYDQIDDNRGGDARRAATLALLERMKKAGTPVDAVGIEAHLDPGGAPFSAAKLRQFLKAVAAMGLDIHITELDATDENLPASIAQRDQMLADAYRQFLDVALDEAAVKVVMTWGLSDRYSWVNSDQISPGFRRKDDLPSRPLPFDRALQRKPIWYALAQSFQHAPVRTPTKAPPAVAAENAAK